MNYAEKHMNEAAEIIKKIDTSAIEKIADLVANLKVQGGRIFFLGVGGSAGNCSHAVNDFRKIVGIESYAPTDNVSELTARTNDEGWSTVFVEWLKVSKLQSKDALFIFSVGGGNLEKNIRMSKAKINPELNYNTIYKKGELDIGINKDRLRIGFKKRF